MSFKVAIGSTLALLGLASCADRNSERDAEMDMAGFVPMKAGLWETKLVFSDIDLPSLGKGQRRQIMDEMAKNASGRTCLSADTGAKPAADFFGGDGAENCVYKKFAVSGQNLKLQLSCGMEGMGTADIALSGAMGKTEFNYDSAVAIRLPMVGKVKMTGNAIGKYVGACPAA